MYQRILVAIDGSAASAKAVQAAVTLAKQLGARIRLTYVIEEVTHVGVYDTFGYAAGLVDSLKEQGVKVLSSAAAEVAAAGIEVDHALLDQPGQRLGDAIANTAKLWNADLIVVGTHGRQGVSRFVLGSGAEQIIRNAPVHVLVIREPDETDTSQVNG